MTDTLNDSEFRRYALLGAEARLLQIDKEAASIYQAFPELRKQAGAQDAQKRTPDAAGAGKKRRRGGMSAAQREAVRERMKRYWAQRRSSGATSADAASATDTASTTGAASTPGGARKAKSQRAKTAGSSRGPRKMSAAARKRISDAQKARWAKRRRANA
jgi:hypothetical protein